MENMDTRLGHSRVVVLVYERRIPDGHRMGVAASNRIVGVHPRDATRAYQLRGGKALRKLGYDKHRTRINGALKWVWIKEATDEGEDLV